MGSQFTKTFHLCRLSSTATKLTIHRTQSRTNMVVRVPLGLSALATALAQSVVEPENLKYLNTTVPSKCWGPGYAAPKCCLHIPNDECWMGDYNEKTCCDVDTIMSAHEFGTLKHDLSTWTLDLSCGCRPENAVDWLPTGERDTFWFQKIS